MPRRIPTWPGSLSAVGPKKHAIQDGKGCAIAAVATLAGLPYVHVKEAAFNLREEGLGGMRVERIIELIDVVTRERWAYHGYSWWSRKPLRSSIIPVPFVLGIITSPDRRGCHAIIVKSGVVFDSNDDSPAPIGEYEHADWTLRGYIFKPTYNHTITNGRPIS